MAEAARAIAEAQPAMAAVYNAAQAAFAGRLREFLENLQRAPDEIARRAAPMLAGRVVLTHSYSATVIHALSFARPARVIATESLPGGEGRTTARELAAELIPDAAAYRELAGVDVVVVGADAVTPDAVINKVGTALVALAARARGVPCCVLCGSEKLAGPEWKPVLGDLFEATPRVWFKEVITEYA